MNKGEPVEQFERLLRINNQHQLSVRSSHTEKRGNTHFQTHWLDERDAEQTLVARIRAWTNESSHPPYRKQIGWERYSLKGDLLDREVRYSKRSNNDWLH